MPLLVIAHVAVGALLEGAAIFYSSFMLTLHKGDHQRLERKLALHLLRLRTENPTTESEVS